LDRVGNIWSHHLEPWFATKGVHIALVLIFAVLATRMIRWVVTRVIRRLERDAARDAGVLSEGIKHRRTIASVVSSVVIAVLYIVVTIDIIGQLGLPVGSLVAPAAVLGAALGFGAQRIVADLLSGFFILTEKQYGFGDLVQLSVAGSANDAEGTVEDVTLRVTRLRTSDGEVTTIPNGQIVKSQNLSKDWARAVVNIPVPTVTDLNRVTDALHGVSQDAMHDQRLSALLLDAPSVMGLESIDVDRVDLQMVARTLPGTQFEVSRRLRTLIASALRRAGVAHAGVTTSADAAGASAPKAAGTGRGPNS
jgi:small conductance mechanosensitive channel